MEHKCLPKTILPPWYGCAHLAELEAEAWGGRFSCVKSMMELGFSPSLGFSGS